MTVLLTKFFLIARLIKLMLNRRHFSHTTVRQRSPALPSVSGYGQLRVGSDHWTSPTRDSEIGAKLNSRQAVGLLRRPCMTRDTVIRHVHNTANDPSRTKVIGSIISASGAKRNGVDRTTLAETENQENFVKV